MCYTPRLSISSLVLTSGKGCAILPKVKKRRGERKTIKERERKSFREKGKGGRGVRLEGDFLR